MSPTIRIYCQAEESPSRQDILEWVIEEEYKVTLNPETLEGDPDDPTWVSADMLIEDSECSIQLDCLRDAGETAPDFQSQCAMFDSEFNEIENVGEANPLRDHLSLTTYFVRLEIPDEPDELCREVTEIIQQSLAANEEGIVHIEGEGVYDADGELLLNME